MRERYPDLLPERPRIVDPVNPPNNLYMTGFRGRNCEEKWKMLAERICKMDITITAEKIMEGM